MKNFGLYVVLILVLSIGFAIQQYFSYAGPMLAQRQAIENRILEVELRQRELNEQQQAYETALRRSTVTNAFPFFITGGFIIVMSTGIVMVWRIVDKRREAWARPIDGTYALQNMNKNGVTWKVDMNKSPSGVIGVANSGAMLMAPVDESFGADRQLAYNNKVQATRTATAISGEDGQGFRYAATGKFLAGAYDKAQKVITGQSTPLLAEPETYDIISIDEAIKQSNKTNWIVGQSKLTGKLSTINIRDIVHLGIVGSSNTGKTSSTGLLATYYARKSGFHVLVLDAKGMLDWKPYGKWFEVHQTDSNVFKEQLRHIVKIYMDRKQQMNQLGLNNFHDGGHNLEPILIVLEEFGTLSDDLRSVKQYQELNNLITKMMRDCRAVGMHFMFIDQDISRWDNTMLRIVKYWIGYKMEASGTHAIKMYHTSDLADVGEFASSSDKKDRFTAWHTASQLSMEGLKPISHRYLPDIKVTEDNSMVSAFVNGTTINTDTVVDAVDYHTLSEDEKELIVHYYELTGSFRQTTQEVWGEGKYGKFYNDIVREVLKEYGIQEM